MITSAKQFHYLNAMGIDVWQHRSANPTQNADNKASGLVIDLQQLAKHQLFKDILQSLSLSFDQVSQLTPQCLDYRAY